MIEFRNIHSTVKLILDCNVKSYQNIPENIIKIIDAVCDANNYFWRVTQHKRVNVPVIPASLLEVKNENPCEGKHFQHGCARCKEDKHCI